MPLKKKNIKSTKSTPSIDEKKKHAIETYQEYEEDVLTSEEQNSKIPMVLAFIAALSLIVLSVFVFSMMSPSSPETSRGPTDAPKQAACDASEYSPVCAHNGKTYKNACLAEESQVTISHLGACLDLETPSISGSLGSGSSGQASMSGQSESASSGVLLGSGELLSDDEADIIPPSSGVTPTASSGSTTSETSTQTIEIPSTRTFTGKTHTFRQPKIPYTVEIPFAYYYSSISSQKGVLHTLLVANSAQETSSEEQALVSMKVYDAKLPPPSNTSSISTSVEKGDKIFVITMKEDTSKNRLIRDLLIESLEYPR